MFNLKTKNKMKSIKIFAVAGAIGLLGMTGLSSCKQNNSNSPEYNGDVVKTEFSIAIPEAGGSNGSVKYMPGKTTQRDASEFNGIEKITLVPFFYQRAIGASDARLGNNITLGNLAKGEIESKTSKAKVYSSVAIPLNTASFLFYGQSMAVGTDAAASDGFEVGSLTESNLTATNPADFSFNLEQICPTAYTSTSGQGANLLDFLNSVAAAEDGLGKKWYEYTNGDNAAMKAMFDTYSSMHGLSSFEVARVLTDLYNSLYPIKESIGIAESIRTAIANGSYCTIEDSVSPADPAKMKVVLKPVCNNYPQIHSLPAGSIRIKWDTSTNKFRECSDAEYDDANNTRPTNYVYPAQLWYYVNSQIQTSNKSQKTEYDKTTNTWAEILDKHTDAISVNSLTRAVAIVNPIQYAVARLLVTVKLDNTTLDDNGEVAQGVTQHITCSGFPVTAILVGGQKNVGWDFTPKGSVEYTIYDSIMTPWKEATPGTMIASASGYSNPNSTLVLETEAGDTKDVMIAVEMLNNTGKDFYGVGGQLIPKEGKFYVVARLESASATETGKKVFKQDYWTRANLNLKNLKNAYNTIPDLRTPQLELGFSVDLTWLEGHTYNIDL